MNAKTTQTVVLLAFVLSVCQEGNCVFGESSNDTVADKGAASGARMKIERVAGDKETLSIVGEKRKMVFTEVDKERKAEGIDDDCIFVGEDRADNSLGLIANCKYVKQALVLTPDHAYTFDAEKTSGDTELGRLSEAQKDELLNDEPVEGDRRRKRDTTHPDKYVKITAFADQYYFEDVKTYRGLNDEQAEEYIREYIKVTVAMARFWYLKNSMVPRFHLILENIVIWKKQPAFMAKYVNKSSYGHYLWVFKNYIKAWYNGIDHATVFTPYITGAGGVAYLNGVCKNNAVSLLRVYRTLSTGYTLTHELAHNLGASHDRNYDGYPTICSGTIMDMEYLVWSKCSRDDIQSNLKRLSDSNNDCMNDKFTPKNVSEVLTRSCVDEGQTCAHNSADVCLWRNAYEGTKSTTVSGRECANWMDSPNAAESKWSMFFTGALKGLNHCRNPDDYSGPYCYTKDSGATKKELCFPTCGGPTSCVDEDLKCAHHGDKLCTYGNSYEGTKRTTVSGHTCAMWTDVDKDSLKQTAMFKSGALNGHNHCRNADGSKGPYCYLKQGDGSIWWEYCFPACGEPNCISSDDSCARNKHDVCERKIVDQTKRKTMSGHECGAWSEKSSSRVKYSPGFNGVLPTHNFCANPDQEDGPWCYTKSGTPKWEYCYATCPEDSTPTTEAPAPLIPNTFPAPNFFTADSPKICVMNDGECANNKQRDCIFINSYNGTRSHTVSGKECVAWNNTVAKASQDGLLFYLTGPPSHNHCLNPDGEDGPYCYTQDGSWELCFPTCGITTCVAPAKADGECAYNKSPVCRTNTSYTGSHSTTKSGHKCAAWNNEGPHQASANVKQKFGGTLPEHNFCRNPDGEPGPWCYTEDANAPRWEYCFKDCGDADACVPAASKAGNLCAHNGLDICKLPTSYAGPQSTTKSGDKCAAWNNEGPHQASANVKQKFGGALPEHNFCRNPDGEPGPWCYTAEASAPRWDWCFSDC